MYFTCACQVLLHMGFLLKELGPSHRPSIEDSFILIHHLLVGFKIVRSLKAIGVNPAVAKPHNQVPHTNEQQCTKHNCGKGLTSGSLSSPPFFLSPIPWWQTLQQPPLGRVSVARRSNAIPGWLVSFRLLSSGIRSKEQNSNSEITSEMSCILHKTTLCYNNLLSLVVGF